jgi:hypothetical protein
MVGCGFAPHAVTDANAEIARTTSANVQAAAKRVLDPNQ